MKYPIYLDHHATTPVDPRVLDEMLPFFSEKFGNASSVDHKYGLDAQKSVNISREKIAFGIGAERKEEIIFTSGATEADNLALIGVAESYQDRGKHIITSLTEHKAILDTSKYLETRGWEISYIGVDQNGIINLDELESSIRSDTVLISIMAANNEVGTIAPLIDIGRIARKYDVLFHTDATQAIGNFKVDVQKMSIDLLSLSGHKIYGPKGIGALFVRNSKPRVKITEQMHGGGHERSMRSGTLNVPGIVGLGKAIEISNYEIEAQTKKLMKLRDLLWNMISSQITNIDLNGHPYKRLPNNLNIYIPKVDAKSLIVNLKNDIAISAGSACSSSSVHPSHVLVALGYKEERVYSSIRIGLGRNNSEDEVVFAGEKIIEAIKYLRSIR